MKSFAVTNRKPSVGDTALIMDELVTVTGIVKDSFGQITQVEVDRNGEWFSISPFETPIEVVE